MLPNSRRGRRELPGATPMKTGLSPYEVRRSHSTRATPTCRASAAARSPGEADGRGGADCGLTRTPRRRAAAVVSADLGRPRPGGAVTGGAGETPTDPRYHSLFWRGGGRAHAAQRERQTARESCGLVQWSFERRLWKCAKITSASVFHTALPPCPSTRAIIPSNRRRNSAYSSLPPLAAGTSQAQRKDHCWVRRTAPSIQSRRRPTRKSTNRSSCDQGPFARRRHRVSSPRAQRAPIHSAALSRRGRV